MENVWGFWTLVRPLGLISVVLIISNTFTKEPTLDTNLLLEQVLKHEWGCSEG